MSNPKPEIDMARLRALLRAELGRDVGAIAPLGGGQIAATFAVTVGLREYVIRLTRDNLGPNLPKEAYCAAHFASPRLPIPAVAGLGRLDELHYIITERVAGVPANTVSPDTAAGLVPALLDVLDAIHAVAVADRPGFGTFDAQGVGLAPGWRESLAAIADDGPPGDFYAGWHRLFAETFLEQPFWERLYSHMRALLPACPEAHGLVHGNYGYGNVLVDGGGVVAVIDWMDAKYGDPVYDVAWLHFWAPEADWAGRYQARCAAQGRAVPDFAPRLECYVCAIGLDALRFFALTGQEPAYRWARSRLQALVAAR